MEDRYTKNMEIWEGLKSLGSETKVGKIRFYDFTTLKDTVWFECNDRCYSIRFYGKNFSVGGRNVHFRLNGAEDLNHLAAMLEAGISKGMQDYVAGGKDFFVKAGALKGNESPTEEQIEELYDSYHGTVDFFGLVRIQNERESIW